MTNIGVGECSSPAQTNEQQRKRGLRFWMVFVACLVVDGLSALDLTTVSNALPTIVQDLHGNDFVWAGSAYTIASTAVLPTIGGLVSIYGRKPVLLVSIAVFAIGCAVGGSAQNMNTVVAGRAIMGLGGGGCNAAVQIIYADLIPLPERGKFYGITSSVWSLISVIGPFVGGGLSSAGAWRWMFYLNIPLCAFCFALVLLYLHVHTPRASFRDSMVQMDWCGLVMIIGSTISILLALTWGGSLYPWSSVHVLLPLCLGAAGLFVFAVYEAVWATEPTVPSFVVTNITTPTGYLGTFAHGMVSMTVIFYLPVFFQACKLASPIHAGVDMFGLCFTISPSAMFGGISTSVWHRYRPQNYIGWIFTIIGLGLLSTLKPDSSAAAYIGFEVVASIGLGVLWSCVQFPVLAPLPFSNNAKALSFLIFTRCFAQTWGTVIGGTILQNVLARKLPTSLRASLSGSSVAQLTYSIIPEIKNLEEPLRTQAQRAFADAIALIWRVMAGIASFGLLTCLLMREVEMRSSLDERWSMKDQSSMKDRGDEKGGDGLDKDGDTAAS